ncbi:ABC transporter substrate-binding protein [Massiliimalia massiliensis]|uniref:ABC transporter substrate-binding protein n=1 Tax=Massiliimalia massiliensis TaxID=1852384 RepID=UPI000986CD30|nr:ABC transporter substrate-binding protein [Massiliimalia massiliensis]
MKKIISMILCGCLAASLLASCGSENGGESTGGNSGGDAVNLKYYFIAKTTNTEDTKEIQEALNEVTKEKINATVELHPLSFNEYPTKMPLMLTTGDDLDIMTSSNFLSYTSVVQTNGVLALEDLLPEAAPELWNMYDQERWDAAKVKGSIYMVPNYDPSVSYPGFWAIGELTEKYDFDWENAESWEDWEPFFDTILEKEDGVTPILSDADYWGRLWFPGYYGYEGVGSVKAPKGQDLVVVKADDPNRKVVAAPFTDEYKETIELTRKWYEKGYFLQTPPTEAEMMSLRSEQKFATFAVPFVGEGDTTAMAASEWGGATILQAKIKGKAPIITTGSATSSGNCVAKASKNPEKALQFIQLLHTDEYIHNLLNFGIEGKHWVWKDEAKKVIQYPEGMDAETCGWVPNTTYQFGNKAALQYFQTEAEVDTSSRVEEAMKSAVYSELMGFVADPEPVKNQLAAISTVCQEYAEPLERGLVDPNDPDKGLAAFQQKLKEAGIDEVVAEFQSQIDAWASENGK